MTEEEPILSRVERRSTDLVLDAERHGSPRSQFTLWFGANVQVTVTSSTRAARVSRAGRAVFIAPNAPAEMIYPAEALAAGVR
ncbi:hypothetical protein [Pseudonocardia sp.]|jgi:hypothetical protein|uniref:hypothetical protein n=1 Tax=Pseudonocardia sp. TaxID=60912 RepID=UPI002D887608|nr:hypothetical protein [Pseudonocardia sp.]